MTTSRRRTIAALAAMAVLPKGAARAAFPGRQLEDLSANVRTKSALNVLGCYTYGPGNVWNYFGADTVAPLDQGIQYYEAQVGGTVGLYNTFSCWGPQSGWGWNVYYMLMTMQSSAVGRKLIPVHGIAFYTAYNPPENYPAGDITALQSIAAGAYDSVWERMVTAHATFGYKKAFFRLGYEMNAGWMADNQGTTPAMNLAWIKAFEHVAHVLKRQGVKSHVDVFTILNPTCGVEQPAMPDPSFYDIFGIDQYNQYWGSGDINDPATRIAYWNTEGGVFGFQTYLTMAQALGKPIMICESGSNGDGNGNIHSLPNDSAFLPWLASMIQQARSMNIFFAGHMMWNVPTGDGNHEFTGNPDPNSPNYNVPVQPTVLGFMQQYVADGTFLSDDLSLLVPTKPIVVQLKEPKVLGAGQHVIHGSITDSSATVLLCWSASGVPLATDSGVVSATVTPVTSNGSYGRISATMMIEPAGVSSTMYYAVNGGAFQPAWIATPTA